MTKEQVSKIWGILREESLTPEESAQVVSNLINNIGFSPEKVGRTLANEHPTLQQVFMRLTLGFIDAMAEKADRFNDDRNIRSVKLAKKFVDAIEDDDRRLPFI